MNDNPQHVFQILTKRADVLIEYHKELKWTHNIWMGVSVENEKELWRVDLLRKTRAKTKPFMRTFAWSFEKIKLIK